MTLSTSSAMKTTDPQSHGPSATLAENKGTTLNMKGDPNIPKGDIQMEYSAD
jgi:hypothetical protein